jgi:tyrosinase
MKVASIAALAASLFFGSAIAGGQAPVGSVPSTPETFTPVNTQIVNGKLLTPRANGKTYPRLEIRQLQATQPDQFNLFILATQAWQAEAQTQGTSSSYYGVSKIHGVPFESFNGAQCQGCPNTGGYCTHNSILFPAWHRSYLAMYEQQLLARAFTIANNWSGPRKNDMITAAARLRMPYWDWAVQPASGSNVLPDSIASATITVTLSNGQQGTINNPLASYNYQNPSTMLYSPFVNWRTTLRYPTSNANDAQTQVNQLQGAMNNVQRSLQDQVYQLFTACTDYAHFSNDAATSSSTQCSSSLEAIHNTVHMNTGGPGFRAFDGSTVSGGHMTYLPLASYDPLFWLHHTNVDRIFALWQTINPNAYGGSQAAVDTTFTTNLGQNLDANSPLTPFFRDDSNYWTTNDVRNWATTFGYTYPEFSNTAGDRNAIVNAVNNLYGPNAQPGAKSRRSIASYAPAGKSAAPSSVDNAKLAANGSEYQYVANIQTPRFALKTSFTIYIFLGEPATEVPATWSTDANLVGPFGVLADAPNADMNMDEIIISGSIPLTRVLHAKLEAGIISSMAPDVVNAYLKANLVWKIASNTGDCVDPTTLEGFVVGVATTTAALPTDASQLPVYSPFHLAVDITAGLAGGLNATTKLLGDVIDNVADCVDDVVDSVTKGDVGGVVDSVVDGVTGTLNSLTNGLANFGKSSASPAKAATY